jgi:predicted dehydrogenase
MSFARLIAGRARGRLFGEPLELKAGGHLDAVTRTDSWTTAALRFEGDILGRLSCAVRVNTRNRAIIFGDKGRLVVESPWFCAGDIQLHPAHYVAFLFRRKDYLFDANDATTLGGFIGNQPCSRLYCRAR